MCRLSFIVPVYNVERFVGDCLESIAAQKIDDMEVIVVDDGSTDKSGDVCDNFASRDPRFHIIHQENRGPAEARNRALACAKGEYIMFVDSDDFLMPDSLAALLQTAENNQLDVLGFDHIDVPENGGVCPVSEITENNPGITIQTGMEFMGKSDFLAVVWWYIARREIIVTHRIQFPAGRQLEDAGFNFRLFLHCDRVAKVQNPVYCYRQRSDSIMRKKDLQHIWKMLDDYLYAATDINSIINQYRCQMNDEFYERIRSRRDSYVFFGGIRALKIGKSRDYLDKARAQGLYPFMRLSKEDYRGMVYTVLYWCMRIPWLWNLMGRFYFSANKLKQTHI